MKRNLFRAWRTLIFLLPGLVFASGQVVLTNGDIITGAIVKKDGAHVTIHSDLLGDVAVPWKAIKTIRSDEPVTVVLPGGETVRGNLSTEGAAIEVANPEETASVPLAEVQAMRNPAEQRSWERLQSPRLFDLWTGYFDIGLALARGNARTDTYTTALNATRITHKDKITLTFSQIRGTARVNDATSLIASAVRGGWAYSRDITTRIFFRTLNDYEHDRFQDLDLRFVVGGAMGFNAYKGERATLSFAAGADYSHENFIETVTRNSGEANFGNDLLLKLNGSSSITQSFRLFPNLTNTGEYRLNFDLGAVTALKKWLGWHVSASDRYLSNPLFSRQRNDVLVSTGFRVSFAR